MHPLWKLKHTRRDVTDGDDDGDAVYDGEGNDCDYNENEGFGDDNGGNNDDDDDCDDDDNDNDDDGSDDDDDDDDDIDDDDGSDDDDDDDDDSEDDDYDEDDSEDDDDDDSDLWKGRFRTTTFSAHVRSKLPLPQPFFQKCTLGT